MNGEHEARAVIAARVADWAVFRDSGDWERLRTIWGPEGIMGATFFRGSADDFIAASKRGFRGEVPGVVHMLGGTSVDVRGARATSQTKMTINVRAAVHGRACDVTCWGRFYDFWYGDRGTWLLAERAVIYERDRIDMLDGTPPPPLDAAVLATFPPGYRHLAYVQQAGGLSVFADLPGLTGDAVEALYARGRDWLA